MAWREWVRRDVQVVLKTRDQRLMRSQAKHRPQNESDLGRQLGPTWRVSLRGELQARLLQLLLVSEATRPSARKGQRPCPGLGPLPSLSPGGKDIRGCCPLPCGLLPFSTS